MRHLFPKFIWILLVKVILSKLILKEVLFILISFFFELISSIVLISNFVYIYFDSSSMFIFQLSFIIS